MKKVIVVFGLALVFVSVANAGSWYQTRSAMQKNIVAKYYVSDAACVPWKFAQSSKSFFTVSYTAFDCSIYSTVTRRSCWVIAHQVGKAWNGIVLTSSPPNACTSKDIVKK